MFVCITHVTHMRRVFPFLESKPSSNFLAAGVALQLEFATWEEEEGHHGRDEPP